MNLAAIPYITLTNIQEEGENLFLTPDQSIDNHLGSIHAGAIFTLAETQSGHYLQRHFPQFKDQVIAMVRDASVSYKSPAMQKIKAYASLSEEETEKFLRRFERKGRGTISVNVEVRDSDDTLVCTASFLWYVQKI